eukprot:3502720-Amphidinium_carterae.2
MVRGIGSRSRGSPRSSQKVRVTSVSNAADHLRCKRHGNGRAVHELIDLRARPPKEQLSQANHQ